MRNDSITQNTTRFAVADMTRIGLMTAILCALGPMAISLPMTPVPISLATLVILFMAYILNVRDALICVGLYLLIGAVGIPVFAGFTAGLDKVAGPSGGYMIGYFFMAAVCSFSIGRFPQSRAIHVLAMILGTAACYGIGTLWLAGQLDLDFRAALGVGVLPYLPGDGMKIVAAVVVGPRIRKSLVNYK